MQYILTEEEYQKLKNTKKREEDSYLQELQYICTQMAIHTPIECSWDRKRDLEPWGCILDEENDPMHCDDCPAQSICPYKYKSYSQ